MSRLCRASLASWYYIEQLQWLGGGLVHAAQDERQHFLRHRADAHKRRLRTPMTTWRIDITPHPARTYFSRKMPVSYTAQRTFLTLKPSPHLKAAASKLFQNPDLHTPARDTFPRSLTSCTLVQLAPRGKDQHHYMPFICCFPSSDTGLELPLSVDLRGFFPPSSTLLSASSKMHQDWKRPCRNIRLPA